MDILAKAIIEGKNIHNIEEIKIHADWVDEWLDSYDIEEINCQYYKNWKCKKLMPD